MSEDKSAGAELNATSHGPVREQAQGRAEYNQRTCNVKYDKHTLNNSRCRKAANERIPMSLLR